MLSLVHLAFGIIPLLCVYQIKGAVIFHDVYSRANPIPEKSCGGKPADIVFALDASSSIWGPDFERQLKFVQDLISIFVINENAVRIGMMTFSDATHDQFHLGTFNSDKAVHDAVGRAYQALGGTRTDLALHAMHKQYFHPRYSRDGVVHIGIVITDGKSEYPEKTATQAEYAREAGIYLFAVGVGRGVDQAELKNIASSPSDQYVFMVNNFSALDSIKELLALQTCKVTEPPTIPPTTTLPPTTPPPADQGCGEGLPADVIFGLPPKISPEDGDSALRFLREMSFDFDIAPDKVRVALVPQECQALKGFPFNAAKNHDDLDQLLMPPEADRPDTAGVLRYMRRAVTQSVRNHRSLGIQREIAKKIGVVIMDCNSPELPKTEKEALLAKRQANMELFVITVGKKVDIDEANVIASEPRDTHVFSVTDYDDLFSIRKRLVENINDSCNGEYRRRRAFQWEN